MRQKSYISGFVSPKLDALVWDRDFSLFSEVEFHISDNARYKLFSHKDLQSVHVYFILILFYIYFIYSFINFLGLSTLFFLFSYNNYLLLLFYFAWSTENLSLCGIGHVDLGKSKNNLLSVLLEFLWGLVFILLS